MKVFFLWRALTDFFLCFSLSSAADQSTKRTEGKIIVLPGRAFHLTATPLRVIGTILSQHLFFVCFPLVVYSPHLSLLLVCGLSLRPLTPLLLSSPLASAVLLYLRHSGIKLRDSKVFPGLSTEKEKWLAFLKTKKVRVATALMKTQK